MTSEINDLVESFGDFSVAKANREVVKVIKSNPRSSRLALELPLVNNEDEETLYEVFPVNDNESGEPSGYVYLKLNNKK